MRNSSRLGPAAFILLFLTTGATSFAVENDLLVTMNGGYTKYTNFETFEQILTAFMGAVPAKDRILLNAGGSDLKVAVRFDKDTFNIVRGTSDAPFIVPSTMQGVYKEASRTNFELEVDGYVKAHPGVKRVTGLFIDHGGEDGFATWGNGHLSVPEYEAFESKFSPDAVVTTILNYCHAGTRYPSLENSPAALPTTYQGLSDVLLKKYPKNRCTAMNSTATDGDFSKPELWKELLTKKPLTLKIIRDTALATKVRWSTPAVSSDYFLRDFMEAFCTPQEKEKDDSETDHGCEGGDCEASSFKKPVVNELFKIRDALTEKICEGESFGKEKQLDWRRRILNSLGDQLGNAHFECLKNLMNAQRPKAYEVYSTATAALEEFKAQKALEGQREKLSDRDRVVVEELQKAVDWGERLYYELEQDPKHAAFKNKCGPEAFFKVINGDYSNLLTFKRIRPQIAELEDFLSLGYKAEDFEKKKGSPEVLKALRDVDRTRRIHAWYDKMTNNPDTRKEAEDYLAGIPYSKLLSEFKVELTRVQLAQQEPRERRMRQRISRFEKIVSENPVFSDLKARYENLKACENTPINM